MISAWTIFPLASGRIGRSRLNGCLKFWQRLLVYIRRLNEMNQVDFKVKWTHPKMISIHWSREYKNHMIQSRSGDFTFSISNYIHVFEILPINFYTSFLYSKQGGTFLKKDKIYDWNCINHWNNVLYSWMWNWTHFTSNDKSNIITYLLTYLLLTSLLTYLRTYVYALPFLRDCRWLNYRSVCVIITFR